MIENIFVELSIIMVIAIIISAIMRLMRQPMIIGYILTGVIASPYYLNLLKSEEAFSTFAEIGIALLLFMVGLNLNPRLIKEVGKVALVAGLGQIGLTFGAGYFIASALGFATIESVYIAIALTFSSTIIIMKLLSDRGDVESLYGRIAIGILIIQDLVVIFLLMVISSLTNGMNLTTFAVDTVLKGTGLLVALFIFGLLILPKITKFVAQSQEFLLLFSIGWCLLIASLFNLLNFSLEIGALLAGVTLSLSPYRFAISSKMKPLRDFFIVLFFIMLGSQMGFSDIRAVIIPIIIFSVFVLFAKPLIIMAFMGILGYTKRNSFLTGFALAQISEFSLILIALGQKMGHLDNEVLSLVTFIGLITIAGSTYFIAYGNKIYPAISKYLSVFEKRGGKVDEHRYHTTSSYGIILFGYSRIGFDLLEAIKKLNKKFLVVDYNPDTIVKLAKQGIDCRYGDVGDSELLYELNLHKTKMVVSTIRDFDSDLLLIHKVRATNKKCIIICVSHQIDEAMELYDAGATYVIMPHFLGGHHTSTMIEEYGINMDKFMQEQLLHMRHLKKRNELGHRHPTHDRDGGH